MARGDRHITKGPCPYCGVDGPKSRAMMDLEHHQELATATAEVAAAFGWSADHLASALVNLRSGEITIGEIEALGAPAPKPDKPGGDGDGGSLP